MEATLSYTNDDNGKGFRNFLLFILLAVAGGFSVYHGVIKHGLDAQKVLNCMDKNGPELSYDKPDDLKVSLCWVEELNDKGEKQKVLGVHVQAKVGGKLENITSFINREVTNQWDMIAFAEQDMGNYGYWSYAKEYLRTIIHVLP